MLSLANRHPTNTIMVLRDGRSVPSYCLVLVSKLSLKHCQKIYNDILRAIVGSNPNTLTVGTKMVKPSSINTPSSTPYIQVKELFSLTSQGYSTPVTRQASNGCR